MSNIEERYLKATRNLNNIIRNYELQDLISANYNPYLNTYQIISCITNKAVFRGTFWKLFAYIEGFKYGTHFKPIDKPVYTMPNRSLQNDQ